MRTENCKSCKINNPLVNNYLSFLIELKYTLREDISDEEKISKLKELDNKHALQDLDVLGIKKLNL